MTSLQHKKQNYVKYSAFAVSAVATILLAVIFFKINGVESFVLKAASKINFLRIGAEKTNNLEASLLISRISDLERENQILRGAIGLNNSRSEIPAKIILGGGYLFSDSLYADEGLNSGVKEKDLALSPEKIFIGKIAGTGKDWSRIDPVGSLGSKISLRLGSDKEIAVEATGLGRGELIAELPKDVSITAGETAWLGEKPEYSVGLVSEIKKVEGREIQNIIIKSPLPFGSLVNMLILKNQ